MTGRVGCRTATTRSNGNVSSFCRYKTGAKRRANRVPLSVGARAPGRLAGRSGIWACGPHAVTSTSVSPKPSRSGISMALLLKKGLPSKKKPNATQTEQRRVLQLESSCASHVRTRTTPLRHCSSSAMTAADLPSVVRLAPARSSATHTRCHHRRTLTSRFVVKTADARHTTSRELRNPPSRLVAQNLPASGTCLRDSALFFHYPAMQMKELSFARLR